MSPGFEATLWGFFSGGALVLGAAVGYLARVPARVAAGVMAFGSGVLISALSFELMQEAFQQAGLAATATGFLLGALTYAVANRLLAIWGAKHRKRSGAEYPREEEESGSGVAIAVGALLDEIDDESNPRDDGDVVCLSLVLDELEVEQDRPEEPTEDEEDKGFLRGIFDRGD